MHATHKEIVETVAAEGPEAKRAAEKIDYGLFSSDELEESIREDVRLLRGAKSLIPLLQLSTSSTHPVKRDLPSRVHEQDAHGRIADASSACAYECDVSLGPS